MIIKIDVKICTAKKTLAESQLYFSRRKKDFKSLYFEVRKFKIFKKCYASFNVYIGTKFNLQNEVMNWIYLRVKDELLAIWVSEKSKIVRIKV